jgi:hypothetical protein
VHVRWKAIEADRSQRIPDALRGRLAGIEVLSYLTGPMLGNTQLGLMSGVSGCKERSLQFTQAHLAAKRRSARRS